MIETVDVLLPVMVCVVLSLLSLVIFKRIRKAGRRKALLMVAWSAGAFTAIAASVLNIAVKYYGAPAPLPFLGFSLTSGPDAIHSSSFLVDAMSVYVALIFVPVAGVIFTYSLVHNGLEDKPSERYHALVLMLVGATLGVLFSGDLLTLFIFWEIAAGGSSLLMLYKNDISSMHATLKYLIMIILASAFIVYGLSIVFGISGSLNFWAVKVAVEGMADKTLFLLAFLFIVTGYAIEAAIVPFHMWLPDAYTTAPASTSAFLSALVDQGSYYVLLRVLIFVFSPPAVFDWRPMLAIFAAMTMVVGNFLALGERNLKKLIANICIADVGYNLVAIASDTALGIMGNLYFFLVGGITTALAFMVVGIMNQHGIKSLEDLSGLGKRMPLTSLALLVGFLSFTGIPPLAGFFAKYLTFTAALQSNMWWLAVIGIVMSVIQAAYLLRIIMIMYGRPPREETRKREPRLLLVLVFTLAAAIVFLGAYPTLVLDLIDKVIQQLPLMPA
ncbi:MAG: NADH-quinone oxidoreductase subunit N [Candidatus Lokiarchaeota archaeon]|nr:NADH-quinone oxidoreductase subunit N [Candidatus Lokiarchaeota archaeon]